MIHLKSVLIILLTVVIICQAQNKEANDQINIIEGQIIPKRIIIPEDLQSGFDFAWSPDSQRIVFQAGKKLDNNDFSSVIVIVEVESEKVEVLSEPNIKHSNPTCSPDGKTIAYIGPMDEDSTIWLMDIDGKNKRPLVDVKCWSQPIWSPDSNRILFREGNSGIWIVNADGTGLKKLASGPGTQSRPKWSPDNNRIAFVNTNEIWLMDTNGNNKRVLTELVSKQGYSPIATVDDFLFDWSPDSNKIVYAYRPIPSDGYHITYDGGIHPYQIWMINIDGTNKHCLTLDFLSSGLPVCMPDGRYILFTSNYKWVVTASPSFPPVSYPKQNIWMLDLTEMKCKQLTNTNKVYRYALSPDGKRIVFSSGQVDSILVLDDFLDSTTPNREFNSFDESIQLKQKVLLKSNNE